MKPIRLTKHARERLELRGVTEAEIIEAVKDGLREPAKGGRAMCRHNIPFTGKWHGQSYAIKQVAPIIKEEDTEIVVLTVYTFYF